MTKKQFDNLYPQPHCPTCGSPLKLDVKENEWYCEKCQKYQKKSLEMPSDLGKGTKKGRKKFWIYYILMITIIFLWLFLPRIIRHNTIDLYVIIIYSIAIVIGLMIFLWFYFFYDK